MRRLRAGQAPTPTTLASEAADRLSAVPTTVVGRVDVARVGGEEVREGTRAGRRGPIAAVVAGVVQRAGVDVTSRSKVVRSLDDRTAANSVGKIGKGAWIGVAASGEFPTFGTDGARSVVAS